MKITAITVFQLELPLTEPYFLSGGRLRFDRLDSTMVKVETDSGLVGWGEGCPWGHTYLPAHGPGLRAALEVLAPAIVGKDPCLIDHINRVMDNTLPGHPYAKSPIDIACWDILGKKAGLPVWHLLGGSSEPATPVNSSISTGAPDEMVALIKKARAAGYRTHSAKLGGSDPATDIARIRAISANLDEDERVTFDINRAWTPGVALQVLGSVDVMAWVEQPCETLEQCAYVANHVRQPILLDECLTTFEDHLRAIRLGACAGLKVKPNRLGGLSKARQVRDLAISQGWQMHIEDVGGTVLADTAAIHLAASCPAELRLASWLCHPHLAHDPLPGQGARNDGGLTRPPDGPGLGLEPDFSNLGQPVARYTKGAS